MLLHFGFDGFQFFASVGPFALGGQIAVAAQVIAHARKARIGAWR